ncbi:EF-P beta-lysylation protein EpmB [Opacimonas sp. LMIT016]|uniref:EF-P beta-lysylation protein EpmB n=1 Tax=Opacimonas immobilis TaxID=3399690 RepID=UPI003AABFB0C
MHNIHKNIVTVETDWQKELASAFTDPKNLLEHLGLNPNDYLADIEARRLFTMRVPRFFADLMTKHDPNDPLLQQVLPLKDEFLSVDGFGQDPTQEHDKANHGIVHKYENRVLLIVRTGCAVNCRYCFRRHFPYNEHHNNRQQWQDALTYIQKHPILDEVILSGGDPLMANDSQLDWLISQIETISHIKRLRIHTRLPVVLPQRITSGLVDRLQRSRLTANMVLHINHPQEISTQLSEKVAQLSRNLIRVYNQAVILRNINDDAKTLMHLNEKLYDNHIQPYYLHAFDKVQGASHFYVSDEQVVSLMREVIAKQSGYMIPKLVREIGNRKSKTWLDLSLDV